MKFRKNIVDMYSKIHQSWQINCYEEAYQSICLVLQNIELWHFKIIQYMAILMQGPITIKLADL